MVLTSIPRQGHRLNLLIPNNSLVRIFDPQRFPRLLVRSLVPSASKFPIPNKVPEPLRVPLLIIRTLSISSYKYPMPNRFLVSSPQYNPLALISGPKKIPRLDSILINFLVLRPDARYQITGSNGPCDEEAHSGFSQCILFCNAPG